MQLGTFLPDPLLPSHLGIQAGRRRVQPPPPPRSFPLSLSSQHGSPVTLLPPLRPRPRPLRPDTTYRERPRPKLSSSYPLAFLARPPLPSPRLSPLLFNGSARGPPCLCWAGTSRRKTPKKNAKLRRLFVVTHARILQKWFCAPLGSVCPPPHFLSPVPAHTYTLRRSQCRTLSRLGFADPAGRSADARLAAHGSGGCFGPPALA